MVYSELKFMPARCVYKYDVLELAKPSATQHAILWLPTGGPRAVFRLCSDSSCEK